MEVAVEVAWHQTCEPTSHNTNLCVRAGLVTEEALVVAWTISFLMVQPARDILGTMPTMQGHSCGL